MEDEIARLVESVAAEFDRRSYSLAVAESCTGGSLAAAITDRPGVSSFFLGGAVTYANEVKEALVGVPSEVLAKHGAVSDPAARAMATGVRERIGATVGVGITGIAGPEGGSPEKPVGLVHIAVATPDRVVARRDVWSGDRAQIRRASVRAALELVVQAVRDRPT